MALEDWNRDRLTWWLDRQWPDRIAGRFNSEQPMESRKLESRVIAKSGALDRIDSHYGCEQDHLEKRRTLSKSYADTDRYLLDLFFEWLPTQGSHQLYYKAARQVLLTDSAAGGMVELERLEKMGESNPTIRAVAELARASFDKALEKTVEDGMRLQVERDERARNNYEAEQQDRRIDVHDSYRLLADEHTSLVQEGYSQRAGDEEVGKRHGVSPRKVREARRFVAEERNEEFLE